MRRKTVVLFQGWEKTHNDISLDDEVGDDNKNDVSADEYHDRVSIDVRLVFSSLSLLSSTILFARRTWSNSDEKYPNVLLCAQSNRNNDSV